MIVTSPQELVSTIVEKAVKMANMMNIPILGLVENMSYIECPCCKEHIEVFGKSHVEEVAKQYNLPVLARLPLCPNFVSLADTGKVEMVDASSYLEDLLEIVTKLDVEEEK